MQEREHRFSPFGEGKRYQDVLWEEKKVLRAKRRRTRVNYFSARGDVFLRNFLLPSFERGGNLLFGRGGSVPSLSGERKTAIPYSLEKEGGEKEKGRWSPDFFTLLREKRLFEGARSPLRRSFLLLRGEERVRPLLFFYGFSHPPPPPPPPRKPTTFPLSARKRGGNVGKKNTG